MKNYKEILYDIGGILLTILFIIMLVISIYINHTKFIVLSAITLIIWSILAFTMLYLWIGDELSERKEKVIRNVIKNKKNKTSFDNFIINVINNNAVEQIALNLDSKNKKKPYGLLLVYKNNIVKLSYNYQNFYVEMKIKDNEVSLSIDSPEKYDYVEGNRELEKKQVISYKFNDLTLDEIYILISKLIKETNVLIKDFISTHKQTGQVNGNTLSSMKPFLFEKKLLTIVAFILSLELMLIGIGLSYNEINNDNIISIDMFASGLFFVAGVIMFIWTTKILKSLIAYNKDIKELKTVNVEGECVKVKLSLDGVYKKSDEIKLKCITLYLKKDNKINKAIVIVENIYKISDYKKLKVKDMLLNNKYNFHCLKHSKYVINGDSNVLAKL